MKRTLLFIVVFQSLCLGMLAQKGVAVQAAFDELAVEKNVTEVLLGAGRLKEYRLSLFHSLEIKRPSARQQQRVDALVQKDAAQALLHEETAGHCLYELPQRGGTHCYIFYRCTEQYIILMYIEGKATLKQIKSYFLKQS